jgi:hypothetical protein
MYIASLKVLQRRETIGTCAIFPPLFQMKLGMAFGGREGDEETSQKAVGQTSEISPSFLILLLCCILKRSASDCDMIFFQGDWFA